MKQIFVIVVLIFLICVGLSEAENYYSISYVYVTKSSLKPNYGRSLLKAEFLDLAGFEKDIRDKFPTIDTVTVVSFQEITKGTYDYNVSQLPQQKALIPIDQMPDTKDGFRVAPQKK